MALAVHSAGMGGSGEAMVHPFFTAARNQNRASPTLGDAEINQPGDVSTANASSVEDNYTLKQPVVHKEKTRRGRGPNKPKPPKDGSSQQLQLVPDTETGRISQALLKKVAPAHAPLSQSEPLISAESENEERRKRRRITPEPRHFTPNPSSPGPPTELPVQVQAHDGATNSEHMGWEEQLLHAGYGQSTPLHTPMHTQAHVANTTPLDQPAADIIPQTSPLGSKMTTPSKSQRSRSQATTPKKTSPKNPTSEEAASVTPKKDSNTANDEGNPVSPIAASKTTTPPKKMLKLRNNGKLLSPKASDDGVKKTRGKRKIKNEAEEIRSKLVKVSYGSDESSRQALGSKISDIQSSPVSLEARTPPEANAVTKPQPTKSAGPPKRTHPFFAKPSSKPIDVSSNDKTTSTPSTNEKSTPKKSTGVDVARSWAGFGSSFSKPVKQLGAVAVIWPPKDMVHVRGLAVDDESETVQTDVQGRERKLKALEVTLRPDEEVLFPYIELIQSGDTLNQDPQSGSFNIPQRRLMTGPELQLALKERAFGRLSVASAYDSATPPGSQASGASPTTHPAVLHLYQAIKTSLSPFDRFECDNQDWLHKYAPKRAVDVLQDNTTDLLLLRDWLFHLTVTAVDSGKSGVNAQLSAELARKLRAKAKRKRKQKGELDDFLVSDEEGAYTEELTEPEDLATEESGARLRRLTPASLNTTKAVAISGPHGCGKTAAAYAIAQELGFEIFEINSGMRRSGKDLMDKVGDMTRNHLVRQKTVVQDDSGNKEPEEDLGEIQADIDSGRQQTMGSFFKASTKSKPQPKNKRVNKKEPPKSPKKPSNQRQSLILLEEVDVLFEEDKNFWGTVLNLLFTSRRPILMTCTNEALLPREELLNCRVLRMSPPSSQLVSDYLLMIAASEGHLLSPQSLEKQYHSQGQDLRASIAHLHFYCQMALGDKKGGLEWMLIRSGKDKCYNDAGEVLRVVSDGTFTDNMGVLPQVYEAPSVNDIDSDVAFLAEAARNQHYDVENWSQFLASPSVSRPHTRDAANLESLEDFEVACDALSSADILPGSSTFDPTSVEMDTSAGRLPDTALCNYTNDLHIINDVLKYEQDKTSLDFVLTMKLFSRCIAFGSFQEDERVFDPPSLANKIVNRPPSLAVERAAMAASINSALDPLSEPPTNTIIGNKGPAITTLEQPLPILAVDIAPYVRGIAEFDKQLELQRLQLSNLISQDGSKGKKQRTTRASRAALEGGRKENTRRERWFTKDLNLQSVLRTRGSGWQEALESAVTAEKAKVREQEDEDEVKTHAEKMPQSSGSGEGSD